MKRTAERRVFGRRKIGRLHGEGIEDAEACANHGLRRQVVGQSGARAEIGIAPVRRRVPAVGSRAHRDQRASAGWDEARKLVVPFRPGRHRIVAQSVIERQLRRNAPGVLQVKAIDVTMQAEELGDVDGRADGVAKQEVAQPVSAVHTGEHHLAHRVGRREE